MVQTKQGAGGSSWIQFIKDKSKEYHALKTEVGHAEDKTSQPNKKQKVTDGGTDNRGTQANRR